MARSEDFRERLAEIWERIKEVAGKIWEEIVDRALDLWDSFLRLERKWQIAIASGLGLVVILAIIIPIAYTPSLPVIAVQNTSGILGGNWIAIENQSNKTLKNLYLIVDEKYIYHLEELKPNETRKIFNKDFYWRKGDFDLGERVDKDFVGQRLLVISSEGKAEITLVEKKKGFFK